MHSRRLLLPFFIASSLALLLTPSAIIASTVKTEVLYKPAWLKRQGQDLPVDQHIDLNKDDRFVTGETGMVDVQLPLGKLQLQPGTELHVLTHQPNQQYLSVALLRGGVCVNVVTSPTEKAEIAVQLYDFFQAKLQNANVCFEQNEELAALRLRWGSVQLENHIDGGTLFLGEAGSRYQVYANGKTELLSIQGKTQISEADESRLSIAQTNQALALPSTSTTTQAITAADVATTGEVINDKAIPTAVALDESVDTIADTDNNKSLTALVSLPDIEVHFIKPPNKQQLSQAESNASRDDTNIAAIPDIDTQSGPSAIDVAETDIPLAEHELGIHPAVESVAQALPMIEAVLVSATEVKTVSETNPAADALSQLASDQAANEVAKLSPTANTDKPTEKQYVVYLYSVQYPKAAKKASQALNDKGYASEVFEVMINGKQRYRIGVPGFTSTAEARTFANDIIGKHGVSEAWVDVLNK